MVQPLITDRTLATIHALQARLMPDTAVLLTPDPDPPPGSTGTPTASAAIPCRALPRKAQLAEGVQGPQLVGIGDWTVTLLGVQTVTPDQQIRVTWAQGGMTLFEVVGVLDPKSFGTETAVECKVVSSSGSES